MAIATFKQHVIGTFEYLKSATNADELHDRVLSIPEGVGSLIPVGRTHLDDPTLITWLADIRELRMSVYPTQFPVTKNSTAAWLRDAVVGVPDRIMFLISAPDGARIGHCGFAEADDRCTLKLDNLMRGPTTACPGLMSSAVTRLLEWATEALCVRKVYAPIFADNLRAYDVLSRIGFRDGELIPLQKSTDGERIVFARLPADSGEEADRFHHRLVWP